MACIRGALNSENSQHAGHRIRKTANMRGTEFRKQPTCGLPPHDGRPACGMSPHDGRTPPGMWLHAWGPAPGMWLHAAGNRGGMRAHAVGIVSGMRAYAVEIVSGMRAYAVEIVSGMRAHALDTRTAWHCVRGRWLPTKMATGYAACVLFVWPSPNISLLQC